MVYIVIYIILRSAAIPLPRIGEKARSPSAGKAQQPHGSGADSQLHRHGPLVAAQLLDNGPVWLGLLLDGADTVLALQPDHRALKALGVKVGVAGLREARVDADSEMDAHADAVPTLVRRSNREARAFAVLPGIRVDIAFETPCPQRRSPEKRRADHQT